jgi:hypothetical protein
MDMARQCISGPSVNRRVNRQPNRPLDALRYSLCRAATRPRQILATAAAPLPRLLRG